MTFYDFLSRGHIFLSISKVMCWVTIGGTLRLVGKLPVFGTELNVLSEINILKLMDFYEILEKDVYTSLRRRRTRCEVIRYEVSCTLP